MSFGELLKELLLLGDIKMYNLADALGYDKSYISKWINSAKLPPAKDIDKLSDKIAAFISRSCREEQKPLFVEALKLDINSFEASISALLKKTYAAEKYNSTPVSSTRKTPSQTVKRSGVRECVIATQPTDIITLYDDINSLNLSSGRCRLSAIIDTIGFDNDVDSYWRYISTLMNLGMNVDVSLYEAAGIRGSGLPSRLVIVKDEFVSSSLALPFFGSSAIMRTEDSSLVELYYQDARCFLIRQSGMFQSSNSNGNLYYYKYAGTDKKRYLLSSMFPLYMSEKLFCELLDKYGNSLQRSEKARSRYLREFKTPKNVVIYDSAFLRYMSTGRISAFDAYEREALTKNERRRHLTELINQIEDDKLSLRVLSDKNPILNYDETSLSFFMNSTSAYFSNLKRRKDGVQYFVSSDDRRRLNTFLDHIDSLGEEYLTDKRLTVDYIYNGIKNM